MIKWLKRLFHPKYDIQLEMTYEEFLSRRYPALFCVNHINERRHDNTFVIKFNDCTKEYAITQNNAGRCAVCPFNRDGLCSLMYAYEIIPLRRAELCKYAELVKDRPCGFTEIETLMEEL